MTRYVGYDIWNKLPERFRWAPHNLFAHPVSELLYWVGLDVLGETLHDITVPKHAVRKDPT